MPTLTARLDASVDGTGLSAQVSVQVDALAAVQTILGALDGSPPTGVRDLLRLADAVRLPDLGALSGLGDLFDGLEGVVPSDLDDLVGPLVGIVEDILGDVGGQVVASINAALGAIRAVQALLDLDLTCTPPNPAGAADGGGDGGDGDGDGGAAAGGGGAAAKRAGAVADLAGTVLDTLPSPLTVPGLLAWLAERVDVDDFGLPLGLGILDDLREPVQRLLAWDAMSGGEIRDELGATLHAVAALLTTTIGGAVTVVEDLAGPVPGLLDGAELGSAADAVVTALSFLAAAVAAADEPALGPASSALEAALNTLDAAFVTLRPALDAAPDLAAAVGTLPTELERRLGIVDAALVGSTGIRGVLGTVADTADQQATAAAVDAVLDHVRDAGAWLEDLLTALDLSAVSDPVEQAVRAVTDALDALDEALLSVAVQVREQLESATALLDEVDVAALRQRLAEAVAGLATDLTAELEAIAAPAREAVGAVLDALGDAVEAFDPASVVAALQDVVDAVTGVLTDPEVLDAVTSVRAAIDGAVDELASQPITPVTDAVIAVIDEVADLLRGLETDLLPGPAKLALQGALAALPQSLDPVTDPLVDELDRLIDEGPLPFLQQVRAGPAVVTGRLRAFDPGALVGPALSGPWESLVGRADKLGPSALFAPVEQALDDLRTRLADEVDPSAALAPLAGPHAALLDAVGAVDPAVLVAPVAEALGSAADAIRDAVGDDGLFAPVEDVVDAVLDGIESVRRVHGMVARVAAVLAELGTLDQALVAWVDAIFGKLAAAGDDGTLATATAAVAGAVDAVRAGPLLDRVATAVDPVRQRLAVLDPARRLADLVAARRAIAATAVAALPAGATRDTVEAALGRCDPLAVALAGPFHDLAELAEAMFAATALPAALTGFDARHHGPDGVLPEWHGLAPDPAVLGANARQALDERFVDPVLAILRIGGHASGLLAGLAKEVGDVLDVADDRLAELTAGPAALLAVRDQVVGLADRVAGADLAVLTDALEEVVATVRSGIEALAPAALAADLAGALDDVLAVVDLDLVLPPAELATLDATYRQVVAALGALDPAALVTDVVGPVFEDAVLPLVDALDLTPTIDALVARLGELPAELRSELDRVDAAYQELLRAAPSIDLTDLSIDIDIDINVDIDVPSPF